MSNIDHSPVYAPFLNSQRYVRLKDNNISHTFFVATTGNDANNGMTSLTPFLTIQKAIDTIAASLDSGSVLINVADGTYNGNILLKDMLGKNNDPITGGVFSGAQAYGANFVEIRGNTTTPSNVILVGSGATSGTFVSSNSSTYYKVNGFEVRNDNTQGNAAFYVDSSRLSIVNCNSAQVGFFVFCQNHGYVNLEPSTSGQVHAVLTNFISASTDSTVYIYQDMTVTGITGFALVADSGSQIFEFGSAFAIATTFSFSFVGGNAFLQASNNATVQGFAGVTVNVTSTSSVGPLFRLLGQGSIIIYGGNTFNVTNFTGGFLLSFESSLYEDFAISTWNQLGTTPNTYTILDASQCYTLDEFGGASIVYGEFNTNYKYALDNRYVEVVIGTHSGALPQGVTTYVGQGQLQSVLNILYMARQDEKIVSFVINMRTGNGVGHTDTYTVVKNGVDTTMVNSLTNTTGNTVITNPVTLALNDQVTIKAVTDAATAGAELIAKLTIVRI